MSFSGSSQIKRAKGFTLVELLVVIGIIALLISILLPTLAGARRAANQVKCASSLREIGNAALMYANDNKGYLMPAKAQGAPYNLNGATYNAPTDVPGKSTSTAAYWFSFLSKYVTKTKIATESKTDQEAAAAQQTVFWGCPSFQKYETGTIGNFNRIQPGYGMNYLPTYSPTNPALGQNYPANLSQVQFVVSSTPALNWKSLTAGTWYKLTQYNKPAERALFADSQFWIVEALAPVANGAIPGQKFFDGYYTYSSGSASTGQTLYDFYRHGKFPPVEVGGGQGHYKSQGGKVLFNILYADGHVVGCNDRAEGYRAIRQRFPR
jgi:prepilin-type N-terminal cleavage/methylation domain-containing protein/prepilin-type processing-associated H-X9-DG protein